MSIADFIQNLKIWGMLGMTLERHGMERRQKRVHPWLNIHSLSGRRRQHRREADMNNPALHLDWHQPHLLYITLAILFLCFADANNTLQLLWDGALEVNPIMDTLIRKSATLFIAVKLGLTAVCMIILVSYHHFTLLNRIRIRHVIYSIFGMYMGLIGYELAIWPGTGVPFLLIPTDESNGTFISALFSLL
jgi:hypothetical protein